MVHVDEQAPTEAEMAAAKADYTRVLELLQRGHRAETQRRRVALVGKCFRYNGSAGEWPVYIAALALEGEALTGWHFRVSPSSAAGGAGQIDVAFEADLQPGFLDEHCVEVPRDVFVTEFNQLLTAVARYATQMPT